MLPNASAADRSLVLLLAIFYFSIWLFHTGSRQGCYIFTAYLFPLPLWQYKEHHPLERESSRLHQVLEKSEAMLILFPYHKINH